MKPGFSRHDAAAVLIFAGFGVLLGAGGIPPKFGIPADNTSWDCDEYPPAEGFGNQARLVLNIPRLSDNFRLLSLAGAD